MRLSCERNKVLCHWFNWSWGHCRRNTIALADWRISLASWRFFQRRWQFNHEQKCLWKSLIAHKIVCTYTFTSTEQEARCQYATNAKKGSMEFWRNARRNIEIFRHRNNRSNFRKCPNLNLKIDAFILHRMGQRYSTWSHVCSVCCIVPISTPREWNLLFLKTLILMVRLSLVNSRKTKRNF